MLYKLDILFDVYHTNVLTPNKVILLYTFNRALPSKQRLTVRHIFNFSADHIVS